MFKKKLHFIKNIFTFLLDLIFPIFCVCCKKEGEWVCDKCIDIFINKNNKNFITQKKNIEDLTYVDNIFYFYNFNNDVIVKLIHSLKYKYAYDVSRFLSILICDNFHKFISNYNNFIIIPVPLNKKRFNERGFNQSEIILKKLKEKSIFNFEIVNLLKRIKNTKHQASLIKEGRENNLKNAFCLNYDLNFEKYKNYNIIIFDDVVTTGNTIDKCAKVLRENGFNKIIIGLTFAGQN